MENVNNFNWNVIGVVLAGLTLVVTIIIFLLQKNKKRISYEILAKTALLTTREKLEGKIKILYNDQEVKDVKFIEVKIINSGNIGIPATDYERSLKFRFPKTTNILSTEVIETYPDTLTTNISVDKSDIIVEPILMNSKDYFILKIIASNADKGDFKVDVRIKDVAEIKRVGDSSQFLVWALLGMILTITGLVRLIISDKSVQKIEWTTSNWINAGLMALGYIVIIYAFSKNKKFFRKFLVLKRSM